MDTPFRTILSQNTELNQIQQNISDAFNQPSPSGVVTVNSKSFPVPAGTSFLMIPAGQIATSITCVLPDAITNAGMDFTFQKTDSSGSSVTFITSANNKQGQRQTVQNASSYSTSSALANGYIFSDGNNWWVV